MTSYEQRLSLSLLQEQNDGVPIFRLPVELLLDILLLAISEAQVDRSNDRWQWLGVTRVCHRLREVVLSCPTLWSTVQTSHYHHEKLGLVLQRSGSSPLDLTIFIDREFLDKCRDLIRSELHRVRTIRFIGTDSDVVEEFYEHLSGTSAPLLELFDVFSSTRLPPRLFNDDTPLLHTLSLCDTPEVDWRYPIFGCGHLEVFCGVDITFKPLLTGSDVFDMLTALAPSIRILELMYLVEPLPTRHTTTDAPSPFNQLTLPHLDSLCLIGDAIATSYIISHIIPTHSLELDVSVDISNTSQLTTILTWITLLIGNEAVTSIDITHQSINKYIHFELGPVPITVAAAIDVHGDTEALHMIDAAQVAICKALPFQHVQSLTFERCPFQTSCWVEAYGEMKEVEEVKLEGPFAYKLFYALMSDLGEGKVLMPKLSMIKYWGSNFEEMVHDDSEGVDTLTSEGQSIKDLVFHCMSFRKQTGVPIQRLDLHEFWSMSQETMGRLKDVVDEVYYIKRPFIHE